MPIPPVRRWAAVAVVALGSTTVAVASAVPASAAGPVTSSTGQPIGPPAAPRDLTASIHGRAVVLHWRAPIASAGHGAAADYLVVWTAPPIEPLEALVDTHSAATRYVSAFGPGTYRVVAVNAAGRGPASAPVTVPAT